MTTRIMLLALLLAAIPVYLGIRTVDRTVDRIIDRNITDRLRQEAAEQAEIDSQARIEFNLLHLGTLEVMRLKEARKVREAPYYEAARGGDGRIRRYREVDMLATGYHVGRTTYSGLPVDVGSAAVDKLVIPINTRLWVQGYGYAQAIDTGRDIQGARIDLYFDSVAEAKTWGEKWVKVKVLE